MAIDVTVVGGGMIVHDQLLPSLYHLQRTGAIGSLQIVDATNKRMRDLVSERFQQAFPGQSFKAHPDLSEDADKVQPDLFQKIIAALPPRTLVVNATPDHMHNRIIRFALEHDQHVLSVKPLVQKISDALEIEGMARERGLFVGVEYHKRFDRRSLEARGHYRAGRFGQFRAGYASLVEPYLYRRSNFQNWFTRENADPFTYIGCHYVDLVYFITGLRPTEVSLRGVEGAFPNGNIGYLWSAGRVAFENGAVLNIINGLGYPDDAPGSNDQGLCMFCEGADKGALIRHDDHFRGVSHGYLDKDAGAYFRFINPDYLRLVPWSGPGLRPVGYGYDSVEASVLAAASIEAQTAGLPPEAALAKRRQLLAEIDAKGLIATPANSFINELVTEAARLSIARAGVPIAITYSPSPRVVCA